MSPVLLVEVPENYVFLQIFETKLDGKGGSGEVAKAFSGWMLSSNPTISALDHPVYDIWVVGCNAQPPETGYYAPPMNEGEPEVVAEPKR